MSICRGITRSRLFDARRDTPRYRIYGSVADREIVSRGRRFKWLKREIRFLDCRIERSCIRVTAAGGFTDTSGLVRRATLLKAISQVGTRIARTGTRAARFLLRRAAQLAVRARLRSISRNSLSLAGAPSRAREYGPRPRQRLPTSVSAAYHARESGLSSTGANRSQKRSVLSFSLARRVC